MPQSEIWAGNVVVGTNITGVGTAEDTLTVSGIVTDTSGNLVQPDSFFVLVINPVGDSVYAFEGTTSDNEFAIFRSGTSTTKYMGRFTKGIADIIGPTPRIGTYHILFLLRDITLGLEIPILGSFAVNPTVINMPPGIQKRYHYNDTYTTVVDSVTYHRPDGTVIRVDIYQTADFLKPDSVTTVNR